ncbi:hypothetical protein [Helicobacter sp. 13S00477-4]|uniref:hypothetical protein n=1 Tax=Helicobacter sp. 13S00477-4 TaxID=1905759 RepID=UPI000BA75157|nr:hypothetical protein [Helicobacter sp. 13S00477-4]PAF52313.1 hypothetical protein BKH44_03125 [Helicobacter sp. 13S00477-4]
MGYMRNASGIFYTLGVLLGVSYIGMNTLHHSSVGLDWVSNAHLRFQSSLHILSIAKMASLCLDKYGFEECSADRFIFNGYEGGYDLDTDSEGQYWADIYIEGKNLRTSQILRTRAKILLRSEGVNAGS